MATQFGLICKRGKGGMKRIKSTMAQYRITAEYERWYLKEVGSRSLIRWYHRLNIVNFDTMSNDACVETDPAQYGGCLPAHMITPITPTFALLMLARVRFTRTSTGRLLQTIAVSVLAAILTIHLQGQQVALIAIGIGVVHVVLALYLLLTGSPIMHGKGKE